MLFVDFFNIKDCFSEFYFLIFRQEGDFEKIEKNIKKCKYFSIFGSKNPNLAPFFVYEKILDFCVSHRKLLGKKKMKKSRNLPHF